MSDRTIIDPSLAGPGAPEATRVMGTQSFGYAPDATQRAITTTCPICQTPNPPGDLYCQDCGFQFGSAPADAAPLEDTSNLVRLVDAGGAEHILSPGLNTVGRESADVVIADPTVSRSHAQITLSGTTVLIEDLGSTNGTRIAGQKLPARQPSEAKDGDAVRFGNLTFTLRVPGGAPAPSPAAAAPAAAAPAVPAPAVDRGPALATLVLADGSEFPLYNGVNTIGRRSANQIPISDAFMSGAHAEIRISDDGAMILVDIGSTNGTFVDGARLAHHTPVELRDGFEWTMGKSPVTLRCAAAEPAEEQPSDECPAGAGEAIAV